ncbi:MULTISPECIES: glycosyltransferase family 39 protein [Pseudomonas aeruginosa group]|uniref:glycosyltransferase family 39 protein n=1 Tax=Pseudomonas aeruginosa group TaxID=136841 RepID=UPI00071B8ECF|nr:MULTISPECIES: glycosyltransferase family 39 protein [Pseudomonas aeruginosa group]KSD72196.1 hypothetical protein AO903_13315 [Pseudomonas aeruginosa]MCW8030789.1 glycosyltransferase family 39 protein [Pseudomonas aeruginosa]MCW8032182.1 glycosyltransferase family 39 protein [Pseudomonas aeruginosa]MDY1577501.1 glycosyltransferase family 39 protein [Pseudomonas paraeruginosa]UYT23689.1 membrane protein, putative [Pseudomonas aeruginosa]
MATGFLADRQRLLWIVVLSLLLLTLVTQRNHNTNSDPRATLLVSQALVQHGTIQLDSLGEPLLQSYGYVIQQKNGHYYHYFPLGSALLATPVVAIANAAGVDMRQHEPTMQMIIVALCAIGILLLLYRTARLYLGRDASLALTALGWFGSAYASTLGTALWSHDLAVLFASLAIYLALRERPLTGKFALIGGSLFLAYLCRPTMALLAPALLAFLMTRSWKTAIAAALVQGGLLMLFVLWSFHEFGQPLPDYYLPKRLEGTQFATALYGNLLSPARGLLVYSPFLLLPILCLPFLLWKQKRNLPLLILALGWPLLHYLTVSRFPHWWAGWSYGSRLMVDALPGLLLGTAVCLASLEKWRRPALALFAVLAAFSIFVNSYQGLYNTYALQWNAAPNIDEHPELLFDWSYPPFLNTQHRQQERLDRFHLAVMPPLQGKVRITYDEPNAGFDGFSVIENGFRWTEGTASTLSFKLVNASTLSGRLSLQAGFLGSQRLAVCLNGTLVFEGAYQGGEHDIRIQVPAGLLHDGLNRLDFALPDAHPPGTADTRILGMAFHLLAVD